VATEQVVYKTIRIRKWNYHARSLYPHFWQRPWLRCNTQVGLRQRVHLRLQVRWQIEHLAIYCQYELKSISFSIVYLE